MEPNFDDLAILGDFADLPEHHKQLVFQKLKNPEMPMYKLAESIGYSVQVAYRFFRSDSWKAINLAIATKEFAELGQLAIKTLKDCMLQTKNPAVRLDAACRVLTNTGVMSPAKATYINRDNKMIIMWDKKDKAEIIPDVDLKNKLDFTDISSPSESKFDIEADKSNSISNGNNHPILTASETAGSTRSQGQV